MAQALFVCAAFLLGVKCVLGDFVTLGKPVNFSWTQTCTDGREFTLIRRLRDDKPVTVARREDGVWKASTTVTFGLNYTDRIENQSDLAVAITHTNYNDEGLYEFTCGGSVVTSIQLEVVIPIPLYVSEGETVQLPCHSVTAGEPVKSVRWEKERQLVIEVDPSSGKITYGTGSGGKVSVPPDWFSQGDLTLTLSRADLQDRGDYFCYIQGENGKRRRAAASLTVKRSPDQTTTPPPACVSMHPFAKSSYALYGRTIKS